jgi:hypothetical protein
MRGTQVRRALAKHHILDDTSGPVAKLIENLRPLINELHKEGKKNMTTMVPRRVAMLAERIDRVLDAWEG